MRQAGALTKADNDFPSDAGRLFYDALDGAYIDTPLGGLMDPYCKERVFMEGPFNLDLAATLFLKALSERGNQAALAAKQAK